MGEWETWFASWELHLEAIGRRPRTIAFYRRELLRFGEHVGVDPLQVTRPLVREWIRAQIAAGIAPNTINGRLICVKSFCSWLAEEGEIGVSPAVGLSSPPHRGPDPDVMSDDEFNRLLAACAGPGVYQRRNRALLLTLEASGCRASELISMRDEGVDLRERYMTVESKGGGWRRVPVTAQAAEAIDRYRRARSQLRGGDGKLWWGKQGALTVRGLDNVLRKLERETGIEIHAHRLRHRFSHRWLAAGGSEAGLQVAAGWASPLMPRRYGRSLSVERMLNEHRRVFDT